MVAMKLNFRGSLKTQWVLMSSLQRQKSRFPFSSPRLSALTGSVLCPSGLQLSFALLLRPVHCGVLISQLSRTTPEHPLRHWVPPLKVIALLLAGQMGSRRTWLLTKSPQGQPAQQSHSPKTQRHMSSQAKGTNSQPLHNLNVSLQSYTTNIPVTIEVLICQGSHEK